MLAWSDPECHLLKALGWKAGIDLRDGVRSAYASYAGGCEGG